jgi:hypothetical protein
VAAVGANAQLRSDRRPVLIGVALVLVAASAIAVGAWWGFPVQDDTMMIRNFRMGGTALIVSENVERPIVGHLVAASLRIAGEHRSFYIAVGLLFWLGLAAEAAMLWARLFPRWSFAWPAVSLAVLAPVVTIVQFTSVTTVIPCVAPVVLVLASVLILLGRPDDGFRSAERAGIALLPAVGALPSEYALATAAASGALLLLMRRWRGALTVGAGITIGYVAFRFIGDTTVRSQTNPDAQIAAILRRPWSAPFKILAAAWECLVGAWGRAAAELKWDWSSRSTLVAAAVALGTAWVVSRGLRVRSAEAGDTEARNLLACVAAVLAGLTPAFIIRSFPLTKVYETRFFLPVLAFSCCATLASLFLLIRPRHFRLVLLGLVFLCMDRLILRAVEEKRIQEGLEHFGERIRPFVGDEPGLLVLVSPERDGMSAEETMAKATYRWPFPTAGRLWIIRPREARDRFGPRSGCRPVESLRLGTPDKNWPRPEGELRSVLYDASDTGEPDPEPYYRGCPAP